VRGQRDNGGRPTRPAKRPALASASPGLCVIWIGADEIRTHDLLHAMQALSQLSYGPRMSQTLSDPRSARLLRLAAQAGAPEIAVWHRLVAGATRRQRVPRSAAPARPRTSDSHWSGADLNRRHMDFQSIALPTELPDRFSRRPVGEPPRRFHRLRDPPKTVKTARAPAVRNVAPRLLSVHTRSPIPGWRVGR
jgi:hypothetical protein